MSKKHWIVIVTGLVLVAGTVAGATQGAAIGLFNSRGTIEPFEIESRDFELEAEEPIDVAIVGARLAPGDETGWHTHPAPSVVTVKPGSPALKLIYVRRGRCRVKIYQPGEGFVHPAGPHNFVNTSTTAPLDFGVAYFVPVGSTLLTNVSPPNCS